MQDVDLQVRESSISGYTVALLAGRERLAEVFLRHSDEIRRLPAAVEAFLRGDTTHDEVFDLARKLHHQVFQEPIERAFKKLREAGPVRLRIRAEPPEIARLPWEVFQEEGEPLSLATDIAFSRLPLDAPDFRAAPADPEISILVAAAEPGGASEMEAIEEALSGLSGKGAVQLTRVRSASLEKIKAALDGGRFRGVAIAAAGPLGTDRATGYLRLVGKGGKLREHNITEIAPLLYGHRGIRFLLLSAGCAHPDWSGESFESLIRLCFGMKISAALAMPHPLQRSSYVEFLRAFFEGAVGGEAIDLAAGAARRAIRPQGGIDFALPLVYAGDPFCLKMSGSSQRMAPAASLMRGVPAPPSTADAPEELEEEFQPQVPTPPPMPVIEVDEEALEEEEELQEVVDGFANEGDRLNEAAALDRLGRCQAKRGRIRKAIVSYQEALDILRKEGETGDVLSVLFHLAGAFELAEEPDRALKIYNELLALAEKEGEKRRVAAALTHIGERYRQDGDLDRAVSEWGRAVGIWEEMGEEGRAADLLTRLGAVLQEKGEYEPAASAYQGSLEIHRQRENPVGLATALNNLGNVALRTRGRDEAVAHYTEALDLFRKAENPEGIASVCHNLANISLGLGDYGKSYELSREARSVAADLGLDSLRKSSDKLLEKVKTAMGKDAFRKLEGGTGPG